VPILKDAIRVKFLNRRTYVPVVENTTTRHIDYDWRLNSLCQFSKLVYCCMARLTAVGAAEAAEEKG